MNKFVSDCTGVLEAFIGGLSVILGFSLLINTQSLIYALLDYQGIRLPLASGFVLFGALAGLFGGLAYSRWHFDKLRIFVTTCLMVTWVIYSYVSNSFSMQFPVALMSFVIIPTQVWLIVRNVRR